MDVDEELENQQANSTTETDVSELLQAQSGDSLLEDMDVNLEESISETGEHHGDDSGASSRKITLQTQSHTLIGDEPANAQNLRRIDEDIPVIDLEILPEDCFAELQTGSSRKGATSGTFTVTNTIPSTSSTIPKEFERTFQPISLAGQRIVIGDSNLEDCQFFISDVVYKRATRFSDGRYNLMSCLEEVSNSKDVKTVVISALSNCINDRGIQFWRKTVEDYIGLISHFAKKRQDIKFYVLGPFLRTKPEDHRSLLCPIVSNLAKGFSSIGCQNVKVNSGFSVNHKELVSDGVHLNLTSKHRLFQHISSLFTRKWDLQHTTVSSSKTSTTLSNKPLVGEEKPMFPGVLVEQRVSVQSRSGGRSKSPRQYLKSRRPYSQSPRRSHLRRQRRSRSRSPRNFRSANSRRERSRSPKNKVSEGRSDQESKGSSRLTNTEYQDYRRKHVRSPSRHSSRDPKNKERVVVATFDRGSRTTEAKNPVSTKLKILEQFGDEPIVASTSKSVEARFAKRLGPPVSSCSTGDESVQKEPLKFVPAGYESSEEDSLLGFEFSQENSRLILEESFDENVCLDKPRWKSKKTKIPQPDKGSKRFVYHDICGQALNLLDVRGNFLHEFLDARNSVRIEKSFKMPVLTLQQCHELLQSNQVLACPRIDFEKIKVFHSNPNEQEKTFARNMLENIRRYRIMTIDTEGDFKLKKSDGVEKRLFVSVGDFSGSVYLFNDGDEIPEDFRNLLEDWKIRKIQSGIVKDMELLLQLKRPIHLSGWVDTRVLFKAFIDPVSTQTKPEAILKRFGPQYRIWPINFAKPNILENLFGGDEPPNQARMHCAQDCRLPVLVLLSLTEKRAKSLNYHPCDDVFPILRLALDITQRVSFDNIQRPNQLYIQRELLDNWRPPLRLVTGKSNLFGLNDALEVTFIRMAQDDWIEPILRNGPKPTQSELTYTALRLWGHRELPARKGTTKLTNEATLEILEARCVRCGDDGHEPYDCPEYSRLKLCRYSHGTENLLPHSIHVCPVLHHVCNLCHARGHLESFHEKWDPLQMKTEFEVHQHLGVFTSIPFLALRSEQKLRVKNHHWIFGYVHETLERAYGNAYQIGVYEPENNINEDTTLTDQQKLVAMRGLAREIALFNFNIDDERFFCPPKATPSEFQAFQEAWRKSVSEITVPSTTVPSSAEEAPPKRQRISYP